MPALSFPKMPALSLSNVFAFLFRLLCKAQDVTGQPPILGPIHRVQYYKREIKKREGLLEQAVNAYTATLKDD